MLIVTPGSRPADLMCASPRRRLPGMKPVTQADLARRYGYFLDHLDRRGVLDLAAPAGAGHAGAVELSRGGPLDLAVRHASQSTYKLRRMAEILAPERDFSWLREIEKDLARVACPWDRFDRIVTTEVLVEAGLALIRRLSLPFIDGAGGEPRSCATVS